MLSGLTHFAGVVISPKKDAIKIRQIEFVGLSDTRVLLILVTTTGDVQNRILFTKRPYSSSELSNAATYLNQHFAGLAFPEIRSRIQDELKQLRSDMTGPYDNSYIFTDTIATADLVWSPCGGMRNLAVTTSLEVTGPNGLLTVDSIDGHLTQVYGLQWRRCNGSSTPH